MILSCLRLADQVTKRVNLSDVFRKPEAKKRETFHKSFTSQVWVHHRVKLAEYQFKNALFKGMVMKGTNC